MFVIDVVFRSGKHWVSFDVDERGFVDDGDADMRTTTMVPVLY